MSGVGISAAIPLASGTPAPRPTDDPARIREAAQQFEALLLGQILRSAREGSGGWLGSGGDSTGDSIAGLADEQLANLMAQQGGVGLRDLIAQGLERRSE